MLKAFAAPGVAGGPMVTSGLSALGAPLAGMFVEMAGMFGISNMAAGPVAMSLAAVLGATGGMMLCLPNDNAGMIAKGATVMTAVVAPVGVYGAVIANGAGYMTMSSTLAAWGGGTIVTGGAGMVGGTAALGTIAGGAVLASGFGVYGTMRVANWLTKPAFEDLSASEAAEMAEEILKHRGKVAEHVQNLQAEQFRCAVFAWVVALALLAMTTMALRYWRNLRYKKEPKPQPRSE
jgi:hypothetical protein